MAVYANVLRGGTNSFQTEAADLAEFMYWTMSDGIPPVGTIAAGTPITGDFAVQAQSSPNKTVKVKAGKILVKATPTSESERLFTVTLSADTNVTLADNTTGGTRYDVIYVTLPADALHDPAATGDLTEAACILAERHTAAGVALTATNAIPIAEITVANGFSSIANAVIADKRKYAQSYGPMDWNPILGTISCGSTNVITVPAGALKRIAVGDKIWCKDDGVEYMGYVTAVTDTTITVKGGTTAGVGADIAASSVITELYYSKAASPVGFPARFAYTNQFYKNDGSTTLTSTNYSYFRMSGHQVFGWVEYSGLGDPSGGNYFFTPPVISSISRNVGCGAGIGVDGSNSVGAILYYDNGKDKIGVQKPVGGNWYAYGAGAGFVNFNYTV